ncbi:MAG: hypothetical protein LBH19_01715 [Dysgonamonadaceae bacterium]|jgi:hypothetical protein|nr:hypothetical protein [Dysgonamonadaceae bacterium]
MNVVYKILVLCSFLAFIACGKSKKKTTGEAVDVQDTVVVKHRNILNKSFETGLYSKKYFYCWLAGKDTLDFVINATEHESDSALYLNIHHKKPMLFTDVLERINACLPLIKEDFDMSKLGSIDFEDPIFYLDLAKKMSNEYEQKFGQKNISYEEFNRFLLKSSLTTQLNDFLNPLNKKVKYYGFEKFHLIYKKHFSEYLPNVDLTEYPEFTFNAHTGMYVELEKK